MPIFLAIAGILLIVAGAKGKEKELLSQINDDGKNFLIWFLLIVIVGVAGFSKTLRPASNAFLVLIVLVFVIHFANQIISGFKQLTSEN